MQLNSKAGAAGVWLCLALAIIFSKSGDSMNEQKLLEAANHEQKAHAFWLARAEKSGDLYGLESEQAQGCQGAVYGMEMAAAIGGLDCFDAIADIHRSMFYAKRKADQQRGRG